LTCAVYWFHPLFWLAERQLRRESERAADNAVLQLGFEGSAYAAYLLAVVRAACRPVARYVPAMAQAPGQDFEARVSALLSDVVRRSAVTRTTVGTTVAISVALALLIATVRAGETVDIEMRTLSVAPVLAALEGAGRDTVAPAVRQVRVRSLPRSAFGPSVGEYTTPALYSESARRNAVEGIVTIAARIDERGRPSQLRVVNGLGFGLDQNAVVALRQWRFRPGTVQGTPAAMDAEVDIEFSLKNEAVNALIANDMATLVGPGVTPPRAIRTSGPWSRPVRTRGSVMLDVVLREDGSPRVVRILRSLTPEADESALRYFEQWRFSPAMKDGQPVKVRMQAEVRFRG
jgi:TonB family protein